MLPRIPRALGTVLAIAAITVSIRQAVAVNTNFNKANSTWNTPSNWSGTGVPQATSFFEVGVVGTSADGGVVDGIAGITAPVATQSGGVILGETAGSTGTLNISGTGTLTNVALTQGVNSTPGSAVVGSAGRGYLNISGGTFTAVNLTVGGEDLSTGAGRSAVNLSGTTTVNTGSATFGRNLKITGPSVNFNATGSVTLQGSNQYTAVITNPTTHSPIKSAGGVLLGGSLAVQFSGVPTPAAGQTWNLVDAFTILGGFSGLGPAGDVSVTGVADPLLGSSYRLKQANGGTNGKLLQLSLEKVLVLRVDRDSGQMSIRNPLGGAIGIDAYSISSPVAGSLKTSYAGITGLVSPPGTPGTWLKPLDASNAPLNTMNVLTEIKQPDFTPPNVNNDVYDLTAIPSVALGNGFDKFAVIGHTPDIGTNGEDLIFEYTSPNGGVVRGQVEYIGTAFENNLVLTVDAQTGVASLKNDTNASLSFDGYSILSSTGNLAGGAPWTGIGGTWEKSPASGTSLTETNPHGPLMLNAGQTVSIGDISSTGFTTAAMRSGLTMQFIRAGSGPLQGDFNLDGSVDAADYTVWRNGLGTTHFPGEYTLWKNNFGATGGGTGDETFRAGTVRFTNIPAGAGSLVGGSPVPEPSTGLLFVAGLGVALVLRRGRKEIHSEQIHQGIGQVGAAIMSRRFASWVLAAVGVCAMLTARPADAQVQGISLANRDFEQLNPPATGGKIVPFDATGNPIAPNAEGGIPGWTFGGPGTEVFFNGATPTVIGDSSTETNGNPGRRLTLSNLDGTVFQTTAHNLINISPNQSYRLSFDAQDAFTINGTNPTTFTEFDGRGQVTARLYYGAGKTTIVQQAFNLDDINHNWTKLVLAVPGGTPALTAGAGQPLGIEFKTTTIERNTGDPMFPVNHSWASFDNVLLQIAGTAAGDLNGDGSVNITDYRVIRDAQQLSKTYLFEGELTGDSVVNLNDFRAWTNLAPPVGSGSVSVGVPEPSTFVLALILGGGAFGISRHRRRSASRSVLSLAAIAAGVTFVLAMGSPAQAALLAFDPIKLGSTPANGEYATAPIGGQNPTIGPVTTFFNGAWVAASAGQDVQVNGLSYRNAGTPNTGAIYGNGSLGGRTGRDLTTSLGVDQYANGTYYISFMANYGTIAGAQDNNMGFRSVEFWPDLGTIGNDAGRTDIGYNQYNTHGQPATQASAATAKLYFNVNESGGDSARGAIIPGAPDSYNGDGLTHLIVLKYVLTDVPDADSISLFLDPLTTTEPAFPNVCFDGTGADVCGDNATVTPTAFNITVGAIGTMSNFGGGAAANPGISDEYRIGTTFTDVVPNFPTPGDTNDDKKVDMADYLAIIKHMNLTGLGLTDGDVTGDQRVTIADFRLWKDNRTDLGGGAGAIGGSVPEPSAIVLAVLGLAAAACRRRMKRN